MEVVDDTDTAEEPFAILFGIADAANFHIECSIRDRTVRQELPSPSVCCNTEETLVNPRLFAQDRNDIGRITNACHHIRVPVNAKPIHRRPYRQSFAMNEVTRKLVDEMLRAGVIRPSTSPWSFPVVIVTKKDGEYRLTVDYRLLNAITIDEHTPLPHIEDLINRVANCRYYSTLDIAWGYWHIPMHRESIEKTSFVTAEGQYEFVVMPFGLKNAPSTFQRILKSVLRPFAGRGVENYLDDIVLYTKTADEHRNLLKDVTNALLTANIRLRREKCRFMVEQIDFLGYIVSYRTIRPSNAKIRAVSEFTTPTSRKEVQRFNGLANYYRNFINGFSSIAAPLYKLTKTDEPFVWTQSQEDAFAELKSRLTSSPVLAPFDPSLNSRLTTDASAVGIGAIFSQLDTDGNERVVAYYSHKLTDAETRWPASELECFAVLKAVEHFHIYIDGVHFDVYTDCAALQWLLSVKHTKNRLFRWSLILSSYDYNIYHRPGVRNQAADCLSRNPVVTNETLTISSVDGCTEHIRQPTYESNGKRFVSLRNGDREVPPPDIRDDILRDLHDKRGHPGISGTKTLVTREYWWPNWTLDVKRYVQSCHTCQLSKPPNHSTLGILQPIATPSRPNQIWSMDTVNIGVHANNTAAKYVQLVIDHHSRYVWGRATRANTADATIKTLTQAIQDSGCAPTKLICDNGTNFRSAKFKNFASTHGIEIAYISPYHPEANGHIERVNGTIVRHISRQLLDKPSIRWSTAVEPAICDYNRLVHSSTGFAPECLQFGRNLPENTNLDTVRQVAAERSRSIQDERKRLYDRKHNASDLKIDDLVVVRIPGNHPSTTKFAPRFDGPYKIIGRTGLETYRLKRMSFGFMTNKAVLPLEMSCHSTRLRRYFLRDNQPLEVRNSSQTTFCGRICVANSLSRVKTTKSDVNDTFLYTQPKAVRSLRFVEYNEVCLYLSRLNDNNNNNIDDNIDDNNNNGYRTRRYIQKRGDGRGRQLALFRLGSIYGDEEEEVAERRILRAEPNNRPGMLRLVRLCPRDDSTQTVGPNRRFRGLAPGSGAKGRPRGRNTPFGHRSTPSPNAHICRHRERPETMARTEWEAQARGDGFQPCLASIPGPQSGRNRREFRPRDNRLNGGEYGR